MKKFLKIILSLLLFVVIGYFVYTQYQKKAVLQDVIYTDAETVIKVGLHDLKKTLVLDALSNPKYYWDNAKLSKLRKDKDTVEDDGKGIDLQPYSLVLYTVKNVKNTLFTTLKIDDAALFDVFAKQYFKEKNSTITTENYQYALDENAKLLFAWNSNHLVVALNPKVSFEACKSVFDAILVENKLISDKNHPFVEKLSASNDHITYLKGNSKVSLNFNDGQALLDGVLYTKLPSTFKNQTNYSTIPNASFQLYFDSNFAHEQNKEALISLLDDASFFEKNNIDVRALLNKSTGNFSLSIKGTTQQTDTIITYEYDDNFDKVETKITQQKQAPIISIDLGLENGMNSYLKQQGAVKNGILKAIPYYTFYADKDSTNTAFSTIEDTLLSPQKTGSYFFNLETNFAALQQDVQISKVDKLVELITSLRITAQQTTENNIIVKGKLDAPEPDINILSQVFFGMQVKDSIDLAP